jgi:hypothetical protein
VDLVVLVHRYLVAEGAAAIRAAFIEAPTASDRVAALSSPLFGSHSVGREVFELCVFLGGEGED